MSFAAFSLSNCKQEQKNEINFEAEERGKLFFALFFSNEHEGKKKVLFVQENMSKKLSMLEVQITYIITVVSYPDVSEAKNNSFEISHG